MEPDTILYTVMCIPLVLGVSLWGIYLIISGGKE